MKRIYLGHTNQGNELSLDFDNENIKFILLIGESGSGKSIFHYNLYKQLSESYSPNELGFVFLDNTMVDFNGWGSDYVVKSVMGKPREAIEVLSEIANLDTRKKLFIHIEECDMVYRNQEAVEAALEKIRNLKDVYMVYSTSRVDQGYLASWMNKFADLKVVFNVASEDDSNFLIGNYMASQFSHRGERALLFNNQQVLCRPFSETEAKVLSNFRL